MILQESAAQLDLEGCAHTSLRSRLRPPLAGELLEGVVTSQNGFLSDKDSGSVFYAIRLV